MNRLKEQRMKRLLSQAELSKISGVSQSLISEIENGSNPRVDTAMKLANALGCTIDDLVGEEGAHEGACD